MRLIITGGCGFIGSNLIHYLLKNYEFSILNLDALTYAANLKNLHDVAGDKRYHFEKIDLNNRSDVGAAIKNFEPDAIMHLAAESHVDKSIHSPEDFVSTNVFGTFNLLEASRAYTSSSFGSGTKNFVFHHISTDEVYGDLDLKDSKFSESTNYKPSSPYSATKASSDHLVRAWNRTYRLPTIITNCSNNYGPYQKSEKLIPVIIRNILDGQEIPIYGDGTQIRDWLYVQDHVEALCSIMLKARRGTSFNIGGDCELSNIGVVKAVSKSISEFTDIEYFEAIKLISNVDDRPGHDLRYAVDISKIKAELGWSPKESFETGIKKTVKWYLENPEYLYE